MRTNPRDALEVIKHIVPLHMLDILSSCTIVTLYLRSAVLPIFDFKKCRELEIPVRGHSRS